MSDRELAISMIGIALSAFVIGFSTRGIVDSHHEVCQTINADSHWNGESCVLEVEIDK